MSYNMEDFLRSCVERYRELTGAQYMRFASTPFLHEATTPDFSYEERGLIPPSKADPEAAYHNLQEASEQPEPPSPLTSGCGGVKGLGKAGPPPPVTSGCGGAKASVSSKGKIQQLRPMLPRS